MKLVFATNNLNKLSEIRSLMPPQIEILSLKDINCKDDLPETCNTLEGNALQKALYVFNNYGFNCFADDTGLEIDILGGEPGVYSARYAGEDCNAENNIKKLLKNMNGKKERGASFRTVIALVMQAEHTLFDAHCRGIITKRKSGVEGFGYDPIFIPNGFDKTFAEMSKQQKGAISHRGQAVKKLVAFLSAN